MIEEECIIFGKQTCIFVLENHSDLISEIYFGKEIDKKLFSKFAKLQKPIMRFDSKKMQSLAKGGNHQNFILKVKIPKTHIKNFNDMSKIVVLVGVSDVGNIGSIFRSCLAFGVDLIISTNEINASGVARSSSGAFFSMPYIVCKDYLSLANELKMAKFRLFGSSANGKNINSLSDDFLLDISDSANNTNDLQRQKWALFLGSEGDGLSNRLLNKMDITFGIKIANFDSLNVSVSAGILLHKLTS